jgi:GT2 family glycosyltransferase
MQSKQQETFQPLVSIVVVSWNRKQDLDALIDSLQKQKYPSKEIVVVDNASTDGSPSFLKTKYPNIKMVALKKNVGLHRGFNIGVAQAEGQIIIGSDDDGFLENNEVIGKVVERFGENPQLGLMAFKVMSYFTKKEEIGNPMHLTIGNPKKGYLCQAYNGVGFAFPKQVFVAVGGLDEQFFIYHGEVDLTVRVMNQGFECRYFPDIIAFHKALRRQTGDWYLKVTDRNWQWFIWKNLPFSKAVISSLLSFLLLLRKSPSRFIRNVVDVLPGMGLVLEKRKPLSKKTLQVYEAVGQFGIRYE